MRTKTIILVLAVLPITSFTMEEHPADAHQSLFHTIQLEMDVGPSHDGTLATWDLDGWMGGDYHKLWLKSEGEALEGETLQRAEYWAMYSRNITEFWDAQVGIRYDHQPYPTSYLVAGFEGLSPYWFETEAHVFVGDDGNITARIRQENDLLITQKLIAQPYAELNFSAQNIPEHNVGSGITSGEFGVQVRYEITRKFAPYFKVRYERKFGETSTIARREGKSRDDAVASIGLRLMF